MHHGKAFIRVDDIADDRKDSTKAVNALKVVRLPWQDVNLRELALRKGRHTISVSLLVALVNSLRR